VRVCGGPVLDPDADANRTDGVRIGRVHRSVSRQGRARQVRTLGARRLEIETPRPGAVVDHSVRAVAEPLAALLASVGPPLTALGLGGGRVALQLHDIRREELLTAR